MPPLQTLSSRRKTVVVIARSFASPDEFQTLEHPSGFRVSSADSEVVFKHLRWRHWGGRRAQAQGRATTCGSGGLEGYVCHSGRVRLLANYRRICGDIGYYENLLAFRVPDYGSKVQMPMGPVEC